MALTVAIQMDPVESLNPHRDSTLLLGIEAQRRGHRLFYYTPDKLSFKNGEVTARVRPVEFRPDPEDYYTCGEAFAMHLREADVVLMRQDPPFDMAYITATHILEMLPASTLVVNDPAQVRNAPEKLFAQHYREFVPPTLISSDTDEISAFRAEYNDIVLKPIYGHGGNGVFHITPGDQNLGALFDLVFAQSKEPVMVQKFLPEVRTEDRRIILIDGEVGGMMARIPAEDEIRANFRVGGTPAKAELTRRQREICEALGPELKKRGLIFAGLDVIGDWLTEINVTSPTGLPGINALYGVRLEEKIWDAIEKRA